MKLRSASATGEIRREYFLFQDVDSSYREVWFHVPRDRESELESVTLWAAPRFSGRLSECNGNEYVIVGVDDLDGMVVNKDMDGTMYVRLMVILTKSGVESDGASRNATITAVTSVPAGGW